MIINSKKESQTVKDLLQIIQQQADRELYSFESDDSKLFTQIRERLQQKGISTGPQQAAATFQNSFPDLNKPFSFDDQQFDDIKIQGKEQNSPFDKHQVDQGKSDQNKNTNLLDFDGDNQFNQNNIQKDNNEQNFNWDQFQFGDINTFSNQEKQEENKQQQQFSAGFDMDWFKNNESVHSQISQKQSGKSNRQISNKQQEEKQEFNLSDFIQNSQASHSQSVSSNHKDFSLTDLGLQKRSQDLKDSGVKVQMDQNVLNFMPQINTQQIQETPKQSKQILNMEESSSNQKQSQESSSQLQNKFKDYNQNQKPDEIKINLIKSDNQLIVGSNNVEDNQSSSFGKGEFVLKFGMNESQLRKNVVQQNANIKDDEIDQNLLNPKNISDNYLLQGYKQAQFDMRLNNMLGSVQKCESENSRSGSHFQDSQAQQSLQNLEFFLKFDQNQSKNILSDEGLPNIGDKSQQLSSNRKDKDNQIQLKLNENKNMMQNNSNINEPNEAVQKKDNVDLTEKVNLDNMWDEMESYKSEVASKQSLEDSYIAQKVAAVQGRINTLNKSNLNLSQASIKSSVSKKSDQQKNSQIINKSQNLNQKTNELLQRSKKYQEYPLKENVQFTHSSQSLNQQNQINNDSKQNSANKQEQKVNLSQNVFFDQSSTSHNNYNFEDFGMNQSQMSETSSKSSVVMPRNEEENFQTNSQLNVKETNENFNQIKMQIDQQKSQLGKLSSISNKKHSDSLSQQNEQLSQKTQEIIERANNLKRSQNISNENINQNVKLHQSNSSQQKGLYKDEQSSKIKDLIERSQKSIQKTNENFMKYSVSSNAVSNKSKSQINQVKMTSSQQSQNQKEKSLNFEDFGNLNISQSQSQNDSQIISEYIKQQIQGCKDSDISNNKNNNFLDNNSTIKQKQVSSKIENSNNFDFDEFGSVHESESNQSKSSIINVIHANTIKNLQNKFSNAQKEMQAGDISKTISVGIQYSDDKKASGQFNFSDFQSVEQSAVSNITQFQEQQNKQQQSQINPNNNSSSSNSQIFPQTISQIFKQNDRITKSDINQQFNQFQNIEHSLSDNDKDVNYLSNLSQFTKNSDINEEICKNSERKELAELAQSVSSSRSKVQYVQHKIIEDYQNEDKSQLDTLQEQPLKEDNELSHQFYMSNQQKHNFQDFFGNQDENIDPDNQFIEEQKVINERLNTPKCALNKNDFINNQDFQQPQYQNQNQQIYIDQKSSSFQQFGQDFNSDNQTLNTHNYTNQAFQNIQEVSGQIKSENSSKKQIQPNIIQQNMIKTFDQNLSETQDFNNQFQINDQSDQKNQIENQMYNQFNENQNKEFQQLPSLPTVNFQSNSNFNVAAVDMQNDLERDLHHSQIRGRQEIDSQMNQNSKNQMQQFNQNLEYQQKSYQTEEKNDNNLNIDQSISFENEYNQRLNLQDHQQNFSMQNKSKSALNLENQEIAEKYSQLDQQQQSDQYGFYEQNVNKNNINQDNFGEQMQQQFLQQTQQQSNQNNSQNQIKNNDQQNENEANMGIQQQVQTNYTNVANNFEQEQGDYRAQEYKLMSSQLQNSNLCSEDSQDQFSSFQQANQTKYIKQKQNQQDDHQHHNEVSDEQKDSFIYEQDKQIILEYEDNNIKQNDQENQLNNYVQNEQIEEQYQEQQDNLTDKMVDQSNNLNTFFLNQKQQVLYTFDHSQYQQGVKGLDLYSKGEIMYFQDQQSQIESQTQNQQNQFTQDFEQLRKKKQVFDSYGSDSQYQDQDENIIGQQILFSDQIQPTVLETVKEQKQPEIDLFMGDNKDFSNQNLFNPKAKNVNQDDEASFGEEQDEEYEQKLKQQYQNQPVQREDQNVNQEQFQFDPQNQELNQQNEQQLQKMLQNISINDQQNNLQEFQGQHGQFFTHLENQEKNENLGDEEEGINQILENSRGEQIQNHNRVESNLEIVKNPDLQYDLNSQIFQESVINPDGNEIFKSTNRQILELFPSIQHNVSKGLHSHQNSNISIPYIKNSVCQAELSMINESLHQNQKNNNQNNKIAEVNQYEQFSPEEAANNPHYLFENKTQELNQHKDQQQIEGWNFNQQQILSNNNTQQIQNPINNVNQNQQQNEDEFFMADQYGYLEQGFIETGIETNTKDNQYSNKLNKQNISQKQCQDFMVNQGVFSQNNRYSQQFNNIQKAEDSQTNQSPQYQMDNLDFKLKENSQKQEKILNSQNDFSQKRYDFPLDQVDKSQSDLFQENQDNQDLRFGSSANKTGDQDQIHQIIDQISPQQQENQQDQLNWDDFANKTGSSVDSQIQNSFEIFQQIGHNKETQNQQNKVNFDDLFGFVDQKKSSQNLDQKNNSQIVHLDMNKNQQINNKENDNNLKDNFDFLNFNNNKLANNSDFYDPNSNNKDQNNNNNNSLIASFLKSDDKNNQKIKQMDSSILEKEEKGNTNEYSDIMTNPVMMNYQKNEDKSQSFDMGQKINIQLNQNMSQERINQNPFHDFSNKLNDQDQIFDMGKATSFQDKQQKIEQTFDMNMPMNLNTKKDNIDDSIEVPINQKSKQINMEDSFDMSKPTKLNNKQYKDDEESFDMNKPVNLYKNQNKLEESYDMNKPTNLGQIQEKNEESFDMNKPRQLHFKNDKKEEDGGIFNMEMPRMMHKKSILYENKSPIDINKELDFFLKDIFVPSSKTRQNITPSYNKLDNLKGKSKEIDNVVDSPARGKNIEIALIQQVNPNDVVDMEAPAIFMQNTKKSTQSGNSGGRNNTPNNPSFTHNNFGFGLTGGLSVIAPIEGESDCEQQNMDLGSFSSIAKIQLPAKKQYEFNDLMQLTHQSLASLNLDVGVALSEKIDSPNQIKKFDLQMEKEHSHCFVNSLTNLDHSSKCSQLQSENLKKNKSHNDIRISSASNFNNQNSLKILPFNLKNNLSSYNKQNSQTNNNQLKIVNVTNQIQVKDNGSQEISQKELNMQITEETHQPQLKNTLQSSQTNYVPQINDNDKLNIQHNDLALINVIKENESLQEHIPISKNLQENKTQNKQNVNLGQIFGFTQKKGNQQNNSSLSELQGLQISEQPLQNINIQKKQNQNINQDISCEVDLNSNLKQNDQLTPRNQGEFNNEQINIEKSPGSQSSEGSESFYTVKDKLEVSYQQNIDKDTLGDKKQDDSFYSVSDEQGINQSKQKNEENTAQIDQKLDIQKPSSRDQEDQDIKQQDQNKEQDNNNFMIETDELDKELEYFNQDIKAQEEEKKEKIDLDKSINKFRPFAMNPNGKMSIQITSGNSSFTQQNDSKSIKSPGNNNLTNLSIKNIPKIITYDQINLQSNLNNLPSSKSNKQVTEQSIIENRQIIADMQENILNCNNESAEFQQDQEQRVQSNQNYSAKIENNYKSDQNESIEDHDYQRPRVSSLNIQSYTAQSNTRNVISSKIINDEQSSNTSQDFSCNLNTFLSTRLYPNKQSMLAGSDQDYVLKINFKQKSSEEKTTHLKKISEAQELNSQLEQIQSQGDYNTASDDNCQISLREIKFEKNPFESDFENNSEGSKIKEELNDQDQKEQNHLQKVQKKSESRQNQEVEKSNVAQTGSTLDKKQGLNKRVYKFDFEDYQNPSLVANSSSASPLQKFYQQNNFVEDSMNRNILESEFTINQSHLSEIAANDMQKNGQVENLDFNNLSPISAHKMILKPELFQENAQNNLNSNRSFASQKGTRMPSPPSSVYNQVGKNKSSYYQQKQVQQSGEIQLLVSNTLQSKSQSSNQVNKNQENSQVPPPNMIDEDDMWANMRNESSISQNESDDSYMSDIIQKNILDQQKDFENKDSTSNQNQVIVKQEQETNVQQNKSQRQIDTATQAHPVEAQDFLNDMVNFWNNQNKVYNLNQSNEPQTSSRNNQNNTTNPQILSNAVSSQKNTQIQPDFRREALDKNKTAFFDNTIQGKDKYSLEMNQLIEKQSESQVFDFQPIQTISHQPSNMQDFTFEQKMVSQNQQKISYSERQTAELYNSSDFPRYDSNKTQNSSSNNSKPQHQQKVFDLQRNQDLQYNLILKGNIQDSIIDEESQLKNQSIQNNNKNNFNSSPNSNNLLAEKTRLSEIPTTRTITDSSKNKLSSYIPQNNKSSSNEIKKEGLNPRQVQSIYQPTQNLNFGTFNQDSQLVNLQQQSSSVKEITPTKSYMDISNQFPQYPLRIEISSHPEDPKFFENTDKEKETTKENPTSRTPSTSPKQVFKLATSYLNVPSPQTSFVLNKVKDLTESPNQLFQKNNQSNLPDLGAKKSKSRPSKEDVKVQTILEGIVDLDSLPDFQENIQNKPKDQIKSILEVDEYLERSPSKLLIEEKSEPPKIKLQKTQDFESKLDNLEQLNKQEQQKNKKLQEEFSQIYAEMQKLAEMQLKEADISKQEDFEQKQLSNQIQSLNRQLQLLTQNHAALLNRVESENIKTIKIAQSNLPSFSGDNQTSKTNSEQKLQIIQKELTKDDDKFEQIIKKFKQQKQEISQFRQEIINSAQEEGDKIGKSQQNQIKQNEKNEETETSKNFNNVMEKQSQFSNTLQKILQDIQSLNNVSKKEEVVENQLQKKIKDIQEQVLKNNEKLGEINKYYNEIKTQVNTENRSISPKVKVNITSASIKKSQSPKTIQDIYDNYQSNFKNVNLNSHPKLSQSILQQTTPFNKSPVRDAQLNAKKQKYLQEYESYSTSNQKKRSLSRERESQDIENSFDQKQQIDENSQGYNLQNQFNQNALQQAKQYLHESAQSNSFSMSKNSLLNKLSPSSIRFSSPSNNLATKISSLSPPTQDLQRQNNFSQIKEQNSSLFDKSLLSDLQKNQYFANQAAFQAPQSIKKPPIVKQIPKPQQEKLGQKQQNQQISLQNTSQQKGSDFYQQYQNSNNSSYQQPNQDRQRSFSSSQIVNNINQPGSQTMLNYQNAFNPQQMQSMQNLKQYPPTLFSPQVRSNTEVFDQNLPKFSFNHQQQNENFQQKFQLFKQNNLPFNQNQNNNFSQNIPLFQNTNNYRFIDNNPQQPQPIQSQQLNQFFGNSVNLPKNTNKQVFLSNEKLPTFSQSQAKQYEYEQQQFDRKYPTFQNEVKPFDEKIDSYGNIFRQDQLSAQKQINQGSLYDFKNSFSNVNIIKQKNNNVYTPNKDQTVLLRNQQYKESNFNYSINQYRKNFVSNYYAQNE